MKKLLALLLAGLMIFSISACSNDDKGSDKNLERDIEYLTASNDNLRQSIDNLADKMEDTAVSEASGVYERQKENMRKNIAELFAG